MSYNLKDKLGTWYPVVLPIFEKYGQQISDGLHDQKDILQPPLQYIFRAFEMCPMDKFKVLIIGQDPYPGGEADGLAFSSKYRPRPYSLQIIFDELKAEGFGERTTNGLDDWAEQGVLLLNTHLTTIKGHINAHAEIGWDWFTGEVLRYISDKFEVSQDPLVIMAWGSPAQKVVQANMNRSLYSYKLFLKAPHPAAQRHGYNFIGCGHFTKANEYLIAHNKEPIKWM